MDLCFANAGDSHIGDFRQHPSMTAIFMKIHLLNNYVFSAPLFVLRNIPPLRTLALKRSRVLINCDKRLMVIWSAKSACTTVYAWFAQVSGFADELPAIHASPQKHRTTIYYFSELYRRSLAAPLGEYRTLRVIRDPYARTVSLYRYALLHAYADPYLAEFSAGKLSRTTGFSFQQFLDLLSSIDLSAANVHFRPQFNPIERIHKPDVTINVSKSDLLQQLNAVAHEWSLPDTDFDSLDWLVKFEHSRRAKEMPIEGSSLDHKVFNRDAARGKLPFPGYDQLLTPNARARIESLYGVDFQAYRSNL